MEQRIMPGSRTRVLLLGTLAALAVPAGVRAQAEEAAPQSAFTAEEQAWWAIQPLRRPAPPAEGPAHPVDAFLARDLRAAGVEPLAEADRRTLLRRATIDLWGLPPTVVEVEAFLADARADAWERQVDRLLASPRYGERYGQHWLDLVRYAESDGFKADQPRPAAYRYRDYVIRSLNADKPYDRFLCEQLAGDELYPNDPDAIVATGYLRHWPYEYNQADVRTQRRNILNDLTDTTGQAFLGLSIGCARCHDHKFDPLPQRDYFRLQAFFEPLLPRDEPLPAQPADLAAFQQKQAAWEQATKGIRDELAGLEADARRAMVVGKASRFPADVQAILAKPAAEHSPQETLLAALASLQLDIEAKGLADRMLKGPHKDRWQELQAQLDAQKSLQPDAAPTVMTVSDVGPVAPPTRIPGDERAPPIAPGFLSILDPSEPQIESPSGRATTGRRAALARWLTRPDHPLTARVMVNRLWQHHFGRGLASSANDLGKQGEPPTHPELLDWLASEFVAQGWKLKPLHRTLLTSQAYRRSSLPAADHPGVPLDPENRLWWRRRPQRMEAEALRDAWLLASGELDLKMHGPSAAGNTSRRSVYLSLLRNSRQPLLETFDAPDTFESCARRNVTTTSPQALFLLNAPWALGRAQRLAGSVAKGTPEEVVRAAYRTALGRDPSEGETTAAASFLASQASLIAERFAAGEKAALPTGGGESLPPATAAAIVDFCHILLNSNEFLYVD